MRNTKLYYEQMQWINLMILDGSGSMREEDTPTVLKPFDEQESSLSLFRSSRPDQICSSTRSLFNVTDAMLLEVIQNAEDFHIRGGNLKAIQNYLDVQLDTTFQRLGLAYQQQEEASSLIHQHNVSQIIQKDLVRGDSKGRGGYEQRKLPGEFVENVEPNNDNKNQNNKKKTPSIPSNILESALFSEKRRIDPLEPYSLERWKAAMGPMGPPCRLLERIETRPGREHYQDKFMCSFSELTSNVDQDCHIISIGSNDQWGFESAILRQAPHCHTHTFDCTIQTPKRKPASENATFYSVCVAGEDRTEPSSGRQYMTYPKLWELTGMKGGGKLLKMDIEGFEYDVLTSMMPSSLTNDDDDSYLPEQIIVELHYASRMYDLPWMLRSRQAGEISMLFTMMYQLGGYLPVYYNYDPGCPPCLEVLFVKVLCRV